MSFKTQDRVYYISGIHRLSSSNPLKGSEYECMGTVKTAPGSVDLDYVSIIVNWDNGKHNIYSENDLERAERRLQNDDPNTLF